jgi:transcriptional regulator with XRE-family HTH domain
MCVHGSANDIKKLRTATSRQIRALQTRYRFTQPEIGRLSGYAPRSIANWLAGSKVTQPARQKFTELDRLLSALESLVKDPGELAAWLDEPNKTFNGSTPLQVIERGEGDHLWHMIYFLESGQPG